ncbi:hypothetical protein [Caulobacter sp. LjRoot300]|uniref:hypothetical protein n=1 Tax=Caulobacter sp. LjRoot300 TaxID=3342321 RepID=UPI003ED16593
MIGLLLSLLAMTVIAVSDGDEAAPERWALREKGAKSGKMVVACLTKNDTRLGWISEMHGYAADYRVEGEHLRVTIVEDDYDGRWEPALWPFEADRRAAQNRLDDVLRSDPRISATSKTMVLQSDDGLVLKLKKGSCD